MEPVYSGIALAPNGEASPIQPGCCPGVNTLGGYPDPSQADGLNREALNLRFSRAERRYTLRQLA